MPSVNYLVHRLALKDPVTNKALNVTGWAFICNPGLPTLVATYNPDSNYAANTVGAPVAIVAGALAFATLDTVNTVDILIFTAQGQFIEISGVKRCLLPSR